MTIPNNLSILLPVICCYTATFGAPVNNGRRRRRRGLDRESGEESIDINDTVAEVPVYIVDLPPLEIPSDQVTIIPESETSSPLQTEAKAIQSHSS